MSYKNLIGDGKFPNKYWVSESNDYLIRETVNGDHLLTSYSEKHPDYKLEGKTYPKPFKTFKEAECFANSLFDNQITIEDRLSGQVYESVKIVCESCGKEDWETFYEIKYTKEIMEENGYKFE